MTKTSARRVGSAEASAGVYARESDGDFEMVSGVRRLSMNLRRCCTNTLTFFHALLSDGKVSNTWRSAAKRSDEDEEYGIQDEVVMYK